MNAAAGDLHAPWALDTMPADYPAPIVDHFEARTVALAAFAALKKG